MLNYYGAPGYVTAEQFALIGQEVYRQCDADDGLIDYIITEPARCHPDYTTFSCANTTSPFFNSSTCLSDLQMETFITLYSDWHFSDTGERIFPAYLPGTEAQMGQAAGGSPFGVTGGFFDVCNIIYGAWSGTNVCSSTKFSTIRSTSNLRGVAMLQFRSMARM